MKTITSDNLACFVVYFIFLVVCFWQGLAGMSVAGVFLLAAIASLALLVRDVRTFQSRPEWETSIGAILVFVMFYSACFGALLPESLPRLSVMLAWREELAMATLVTLLAGSAIDLIDEQRHIRSNQQRILSKNATAFSLAILILFAFGLFDLDKVVAATTYMLIAAWASSLHALILAHASSQSFAAASPRLAGLVDEFALSINWPTVCSFAREECRNFLYFFM